MLLPLTVLPPLPPPLLLLLLLLLLLQLLLQVLEAEASSPLVSGQQLQEAGQLPRVLVQGTAGGLVATPAGPQRQDMYYRETEYTGGGGLLLSLLTAQYIVRIAFEGRRSYRTSWPYCHCLVSNLMHTAAAAAVAAPCPSVTASACITLCCSCRRLPGI
jgi:hypothetical protein